MKRLPYTGVIFADVWIVAVEKAYYHCELAFAQTSWSKEEFVNHSYCVPAQFDCMAVQV